VRIVITYRSEYFCMLALGVVANSWQLLRFADPLLKESADRSQEPMENLILGASRNGQMIFHIKAGIIAAVLVDALFHLFQKSLKLGDVSCRRPFGGERNGFGFNGDASFCYVGQFLFGLKRTAGQNPLDEQVSTINYIRAAAMPHLNHADIGQRLERLPERGTSNVQSGTKLCLRGKLFPWLPFTAGNLV